MQGSCRGFAGVVAAQMTTDDSESSEQQVPWCLDDISDMRTSGTRSVNNISRSLGPTVQLPYHSLHVLAPTARMSSTLNQASQVCGCLNACNPGAGNLR